MYVHTFAVVLLCVLISTVLLLQVQKCELLVAEMYKQTGDLNPYGMVHVLFFLV